MAAQKGDQTALGSARGRFIESLPRKAIELRGAIALLTATPAADGPRDDMRRRLHTLYASALVFRNDDLAVAVKEGIDRLDAAREGARALSDDDLSSLAGLVRRLPELRGEGAGAVSVSKPPMSGVRPQAGSRESRTLTGLAPIESPISSEPEPESEPAMALGGTRRAIHAPRGSSSEGESRVSTRTPLLQMVVHVLALDSEASLEQLRVLLPTDAFQLTLAHSVDEALASARADAPDVVLTCRKLAQAGDFVRRLRSDPLTDFIPIVFVQSSEGAIDALTAREEGADEVLTRPLEAASLVSVLGRVTGTLLEEGTGLARLGDVTLEEVADRVAEEIRRGIVDAAELGRDLKVPLGEGAEVLAAAWAAVARMRAFIAQQSGGRVRFADRPRRGGPALLALVDGETSDDLLSVVGTLSGRRILVVDDDPAVVWFFAGLLREEGATVIETTDGADALRAARRERPDVVISDVLMPNVDGFALCRELKRDPALADVPVILISWKEDLLHRMRELSAGASGYLRKEAGAAQILALVREVLKPRSQLEAQLKAGGEVRGSLEGTGVVPLLRSVARARDTARVTIRDAWNLFECELRQGALVELTRTASDGSFTRGERALSLLLGASAGRFAVTHSEAPGKPMFSGSLDETLVRGANALGAFIDAVSGASLMRVAEVSFDEEAYPVVLKQSPRPVREIIERLHDGDAPSLLLVSGVTSAQTLESVLVDLARRGAIAGVRSREGDDLVAAALAARKALFPAVVPAPSTPSAPAVPRSIIPEAPNPVISVIPAPDERELPSVLDPLAALSVRTPAPAASVVAMGESQALLRAVPRAETQVSETIPEALAVPQANALSAGAARVDEASASTRVGDDDELPTTELSPVSREQADAVLAREAAASASDPVAAQAGGGAPSVRRASEPPPASESAPEGDAATSSSVRPRPLESELAPEADSAAKEERRSRGTLLGWVLAAVLMLAAGFWLERQAEQPSSDATLHLIGERNEQQPADPAPEVSAPASEQAEAPSEVPAEPTATGPMPLMRGTALVAAQDVGFKVYDTIIDASFVLTRNQGLLVIEANGAGPATLNIDGKSVGQLPVKVALETGIHELSIQNGDRVSYRYLSVSAGKSWVLSQL